MLGINCFSLATSVLFEGSCSRRKRLARVKCDPAAKRLRRFAAGSHLTLARRLRREHIQDRFDDGLDSGYNRVDRIYDLTVGTRGSLPDTHLRFAHNSLQGRGERPQPGQLAIRIA